MSVPDLVTVAVSPEGITPEALLNVDRPGPRGYFADDETAVGWWGAATRVTAEALAALPTVALPRDDDPWPPRAFVVARFAHDPRNDEDPAWAGLPGAVMVLPRLLVVRVGGRTTARWIRPRGEAPPPLPPCPVVGSASETLVTQSDREGWNALVEAALTTLRGGSCQKLVVARRLALARRRGWDGGRTLAAMAARAAPGTTCFAFGDDDALFVGATPETLVARRGTTLRTEALAGSIPRDAAHDARDCAALLASEKDRREHGLVREMIRETVAPWCERLQVAEDPGVKSLRALHHLWTPFEGTLRADAPDLLTMAARLHPTPAVAGLPTPAAVAWIARHEPVPRGWYAGPVGWVDARGDGRFVVGIRSALLRGERAWAYAGAGIVPGSDPAKEWDETAVKLSLMREALGA